MSICWSCHWGWPKPVADIYLEALRRLDGYDFPLKFSGSHVVWEDENFNLAESCLESFDKYRGDYSEEELASSEFITKSRANICTATAASLIIVTTPAKRKTVTVSPPLSIISKGD